VVLAVRAVHYIDDPYPYYHRLRAADPVHWHAAMELWTVTRHADACAALLHPALSSRRPEPQLERYDATARPLARSVYGTLSTWMVRLDAPAHTRLRAFANRALHARVMTGMRERLRRTADGLLDALPDIHQLEVISQLAAPLALSGIASLLGVPAAQQGQLRQWTDAVGAAAEAGLEPEGLADAQHSLEAARDCFGGILAQRRQSPQADLLSGLLRVSAEGDCLDEEEVTGISMLLLLAGHDTVKHMVANSIGALLQNPTQLGRLRSTPELLESAVRECLRYDSPLQGVLRVANADLQIGAKRISRGQSVVIWLAAANRDPVEFPEPDRFNIARENTRHLAFGHGAHRCLGAALALPTIGAALEALLARTPASTGRVRRLARQFSVSQSSLVVSYFPAQK